MVHNVATALLACAALLAVRVPSARGADDAPEVVPYDPDGNEEEYDRPLTSTVRQRRPTPPPQQPYDEPLRARRPLPAPLPPAPGTQPQAAAATPGGPPAAVPRPVPPARAQLPEQPSASEAGLGMIQFVLGAATFGGTILLAASSNEPGPVVLGVLAAPLTTAGTVCLVGLVSEQSRSPCGATIGLSYLGAIAGLLVGYVAAGVDDYSDSSMWMIVAGPIVGASVGAVAAWHGYKSPLPKQNAAPPPPLPLPRPLARDRDLGRRLTVPILTLSF